MLFLLLHVHVCYLTKYSTKLKGIELIIFFAGTRSGVFVKRIKLFSLAELSYDHFLSNLIARNFLDLPHNHIGYAIAKYNAYNFDILPYATCICLLYLL
jgi:hypothetical protein